MYAAIASGSFERVCVLFNIAAMQSQIAETQNIGSDDGRKMAAKLFQVYITAVLTEKLNSIQANTHVMYCMYGMRSVSLWQFMVLQTPSNFGVDICSL